VGKVLVPFFAWRFSKNHRTGFEFSCLRGSENSVCLGTHALVLSSKKSLK
jgi:hypothetical protein